MIQNDRKESGRSLTEMLGVLVIVGILSIAAIAGFRYAMDKKQSNDLINAVALRTQVALSQLVKSNEITLVEFPESVNGATILGVYQDLNIIFSVSPVPLKVCRVTLDNKPSHWSVSVNGVPSGTCAEGGNDLDITIDKEAGAGGGDTPAPDLCGGTCGECQTCNVTTNACDSLPDTMPCGGGTKECKAGVCSDKTICPPESYPGANPGECCMGTGTSGGEICCPIGQYPWCGAYSGENNETCYYASCYPTQCKPSLFKPSNNVCCKETETPYCKWFHRDGSCDSAGCSAGECTPQTFDSGATEGLCCSKPNGTPYCSLYNSNRPNECWESACGKTGCVQNQIEGVNSGGYKTLLGTCCLSNETSYCEEYSGENCVRAACCGVGEKPYCYAYDSYLFESTGKFQCMYAGCGKDCSVPSFPVMYEQQCCKVNETAYCGDYHPSGVCADAYCAKGKCTPYCAERYSNGLCYLGGCCPDGKTVTPGVNGAPDTCN